MTTHVGDRAGAIFLALSYVSPDQRTAMLADQCGDEEQLRAEIERLLAGLDLPDSFLDATQTAATGATPIGHDGVSQPAGAVIGDFVVIRQIGAGATGVVYLAHQRHPARIVALKVLRRESMASVVQRRFEIEAELLGHLHHPGIAQIYAAHPGDETTPPYIAMELVSGPPLTEFADSHRLSAHDRVELVARDFGGGEGMTDLHITADARYLATCHGGNGLVRLFDLTADARTDRWPAHSRAVTGLVVDAGPAAPAAAGTVVSVAGDGVVSGVRPGHAAPVASWPAGAPVNAVAISDNGQ